MVARYRTPYPGEPTSFDPASRERRRQAAARPAHGVTHALRVTLFAQALIRLYARAGRAPAPDAFGVVMAAAFHDTARQGDGEDLWERESAHQVAVYMTSLGAAPARVELLRHAVANKDPAARGEAFTSDEQRIIHDADCLDIVRVLAHPDDFRRSELCFFHFEELDAALKAQLIDEAIDVVLISEYPAIKMHLEVQSTRVYEDLVRALWQIERRHRRWPVLAELWSDVFAYAAQLDSGSHREVSCRFEASPARPSSQLVYHGSSTPMLTTLEPRKQSIPREVERAAWPELVYASDLPAFAAAHAFSWGTDEGFQLVVSAGGRVTMLVPGQHRHRMQRPVYLYAAYAGSFVSTSEEHSGHTFHSSEPVAVLSCAAFASVEEAIKHHGGDVSYVGSS